MEIKDLSISFTQYTNKFRQSEIKVISNLSLDIYEGEVLAIIGASGSGKSLLAHSILGILPKNATISGTIKYKQEELTKKRQEKLRGEEISLIPQSVTSLDPLMKVGKQIRTSVRSGNPIEEQRKIFKKYSLLTHIENMLPFQLSGGMARRVLVSTAMVSGAELVIADEPTPGLDLEVIKDTVESFRELARKGSSVMLITHDIEMALQVASRIAILYAGTVIEIALVEDFSGKGERLRHPYSKLLWKALPQNKFTSISSAQPYINEAIKGCLFVHKCSMATEECYNNLLEIRELRGGEVRCFHAS